MPRTCDWAYEDAGHVLRDLLGYNDARIGELGPGGAFGQAIEQVTS